jgi:predicted RNA binding protein YcfA (HicA-like mRNA interferase family)
LKVSEVLRHLRDDGWFRVKAKGGHRQFRHPTRPGRVTVSGKPSHTIPTGTLKSIFRQAGWDDETEDR